MAPKIFMTGATGYIGGTVFELLHQKHPNFQYTAMMRAETAPFKSRYPDVKTVYGDYDNLQLLEDCAAEADVVIHCGNSDHMPAVEAVLKGCARNPNVSYMIHLSGTGTIADFMMFPTGDYNSQIWSDTKNIKDIQSLPDYALHRPVDKLLQDFAVEHGDNVKVAIICPPDIYGTGTGTVKKTSWYVPVYVAEILKRGYSFYLGKGENTRGMVHVEDLAELYVLLVEDAVAGGKRADWGKDAFFFCEKGEVSAKETSTALGKILTNKGLITSAEPKQLDPEEAMSMLTHFPFPGIAKYMFGANSRSRADRAKELLGWKPTQPSFWDTLEEDAILGLDPEAQLKAFPSGPKDQSSSHEKEIGHDSLSPQAARLTENLLD